MISSVRAKKVFSGERFVSIVLSSKDSLEDATFGSSRWSLHHFENKVGRSFFTSSSKRGAGKCGRVDAESTCRTRDKSDDDDYSSLRERDRDTLSFQKKKKKKKSEDGCLVVVLLRVQRKREEALRFDCGKIKPPNQQAFSDKENAHTLFITNGSSFTSSSRHL